MFLRFHLQLSFPEERVHFSFRWLLVLYRSKSHYSQASQLLWFLLVDQATRAGTPGHPHSSPSNEEKANPKRDIHRLP
jgi:hypothetical protein